jgi:hypothetical protein
MPEVQHAVQFFQTVYGILLALALGEAFKQFVLDGDQNIRWDRSASLWAFLFMIVPFFHGMNQYMYITYLHGAQKSLETISAPLLLDGLMFLAMAAVFFVLSRSLSPSHWVRFYVSTFALLAIDTVWILSAIYRGSDLWAWLALNGVVASVLAIVMFVQREKTYVPQQLPPWHSPSWLCAAIFTMSTTIDYVVMLRYFFK